MKKFGKIAVVLLFLVNIAAFAKYRVDTGGTGGQVRAHTFCHATGCVTAGPDC